VPNQPDHNQQSHEPDDLTEKGSLDFLRIEFINSFHLFEKHFSWLLHYYQNNVAG